MNAFAPADKTPMVALPGSAMQQTWKPGQRRGYGAPVGKFHQQRVRCHFYILSRDCAPFICQSIHAIPAIVVRDVLEPTGESDSIQHYQSHRSFATAPVPARISPGSGRAQRERAAARRGRQRRRKTDTVRFAKPSAYQSSLQYAARPCTPPSRPKPLSL